MDTLRVWTGGTDTSLPDFSTPIGGTIGTPPTTQSNFSSYLPSSSSLRSSVPSWVPFVGGADASQQDNDCLPSLSWTQRIICFAALLLIGIVFTAFSTMVIMSPRTFAKYYTLGNLFIIGSTFFLMGPRRQLANMFDPSRLTAALAYFGSMAGTLSAAVYLQSTLLTLVMVVVQLCASVWYGSSYIPFAQSLLKSTASTILPL